MGFLGSMGNRYHTLRAKKYQGKPRGINARPKTFKTEESAKKWAELNKITKYKLENLRNSESKSSKLRIVLE